MKVKANQRVTLTKRLLKESLLELMKHKSISRISVKELCEDSGINRSTFYNHYSSPADVLADIENSVIKDLEQIWEREFTKGDWPINKRIEALCSYIKDNADLFRLLLRDADTSSGFPAMLMNSAHVRITYDRVLMHSASQEDNQLMTTFLSNGAYFILRRSQEYSHLLQVGDELALSRRFLLLRML